MSRAFPFLLASLCTLLATTTHAAVSRTYVASYGDDANTVYSCDFAHPCRTFQTAFSQTTTGGEILAVDGSGYGTIVIDRSVSVIANPGIFAGIGVFAGGTGVSIATAGVRVTLRGLTLNGQGGNYGIHMTNGTRLSVENCVIANFSSGIGIRVVAAAKVRIVDSLFRDNDQAVFLSEGATASISGSRFLGYSVAVLVADGNAAATTTAFIDRSVASGSNYGFIAQSSVGGKTRLFVTESVASDNGVVGIYVSAVGGGTSVASVSNSLVSGSGSGLSSYGSGARLIASGNTVTQNATGLFQGSSSTFGSDGTNTVRDNTAPFIGTITPVARM